ncbi:MAG: hypothetical protein K2P84_13495 [Undibacterium sp.]|nr:hypothetical protein [Undibacterium sp.]
MALYPCRECNKPVSTESQSCPSCGVPKPTMRTGSVQATKNKSRLPILLLIFIVIAVLFAGLGRKRDVAAPSGNQQQITVVDDGKSKAKREIEKSMAKNSTSVYSVDSKENETRKADQKAYGNGALAALACIEHETSCTSYDLERHLKGLPIGWVEAALGTPQNEQRLSAGHYYYWNVVLDEGGRLHTYKLQLQYSSECSTGFIHTDVACTFNFYG